MYEYTPIYTRKKELLTVSALLAVAAVLMVASKLPWTSLPALWQLASFVLFTGAILVTVRFLMKSYTYCVSFDGESASQAPEFTIVERSGKRVQTVCRILLSDILEAERVTKENGASLKAKRRGKNTWQYYAELSAPDLCQLTVQDGDEWYFLLLQADDRLLSFFKNT